MLNPPVVCLCWHGETPGPSWVLLPVPITPPAISLRHIPFKNILHTLKSAPAAARDPPASFSSLSNSYFPVQPRARGKSRTDRTLFFLCSQGRDHHCKP